jgi:hypothetical protein
MSFPHARAPALGLALMCVSIAGGCSDGGGGATDGGASDGGGIDAEDLCPGRLTFEALVAEAEMGGSVFDVEVAEADTSNGTTSAPNGRAVLCLPSAGDSQVRSTKAGYLTRVDTVSPASALPTLGSDQPYPIDVLFTSAADELLMSLGLVRDDMDATLLLVSVVSYPEAQPLVGATVAIDKASGGAFARDPSGVFTGGDQVGQVSDGRIVLFANAALGGGAQEGRATITITPPEEFAGACTGPLSVELEAGGVSGAFFACQ